MLEANALNQEESPEDRDPRPRPVVLLLVDGWGIAPDGEGNAVAAAKTPTIVSLIKEYPVAALSVRSFDWNQRYLALGSGQAERDDESVPPETLSGECAKAGLRQLKISDSERFAAATYFFNGLTEEKAAGEDWLIVSTPGGPDDKAANDFKAVLKAAVKAIKDEDRPDLIVISLSYLDLVAMAAGGRPGPVIKAMETVDRGIKSIRAAVEAAGGVLIITSAGGNAEQLINLRTEEIDRGLTVNPVPFLIVSEEFKGLAIGRQDAPDNDLSLLEPAGALADVTPTLLAFLGLDTPEGMAGRDLLAHVR